MLTMLDEPPEDPPGDMFAEVRRAPLIRLLDHIRDRSLQNHTMHAHWNEGATGDFKDCTRGDCIEARHILTEWEWL